MSTTAAGTRPPDAGRRTAQAITDLLSPVRLAVGLLLLVGTGSGDGPLVGLGWGLLAATFAGLIPYAFITVGVRRGHYTDRHIRRREQRLVPLAVAAFSVVAGVAILKWLGAPQQLVALVVAMLVGLLVTLVITLAWKVSVHSAVAGGAATIAVLAFGPVANLLGVPAVVAIGWSRVRLRDHTSAQVAVGAGMGACVAATVFTLLRG